MKTYFQNCEELKFEGQGSNEWKSYFFAEVSALAYHDGTRAKKEVNKIGFNNYKFFDNDGTSNVISLKIQNILLLHLEEQNLNKCLISKQTYLQ